MSQGGEDGGKAGCGAIGAALLAALGIGVARGADDCAMIACRSAGSSADNALVGSADDVARLGVGSSSDDLARLGVGSSDDLARLGVGSSSDDLARLGIVAGEEGLHGRSLADDVLEAGAEEVTFEVIEWTLDDEEDDEDDVVERAAEVGRYLRHTEPSSPGTDRDEGAVDDTRSPDANASADRLIAHMMVRDARLRIWAPEGSTFAATRAEAPAGTTVRAVDGPETALADLAGDPEARPLAIAGVTRDDGGTLALGGDATVSIRDIHRRCWEQRRSCIVLACSAIGGGDAGDACLAESADIFAAAAREASRGAGLQSDFVRHLLALRRHALAAPQLIISRIDLGLISRRHPTGTPRIIASRHGT